MIEDAGHERDPAVAEPAYQGSRNEPSPGPRQPGSPGSQARGDWQPGRAKRGAGQRGKSLYTFADGLVRCFCRNAKHVPPLTFPVAGRSGVATPALVELARTDQVILLCDLLHEGPHMWPDGEQFSPG
ncbi:hypothetical protein BH24CHL4_BH24CHL4_17600 [soil metagenome]